MKVFVECGRTKWPSLIASLLLCPIALVATMVVAPNFPALYGGLGERILYVTLLSLPLAGVLGIVRFFHAPRWFKWSAAVLYVVAAFAITLAAIIFVGCTLATACF